MSIMDKIKARIQRPHDPITEVSKRPPIDMANKLRQNAAGLEAHYGDTQFIQRIRAAADALEELETTLQAILMTTRDEATKVDAEECLRRYDAMRK